MVVPDDCELLQWIMHGYHEQIFMRRYCTVMNCHYNTVLSFATLFIIWFAELNLNNSI